MTLAAGAQLGPYEILATLGAGGQGEVYRARDGRLDREVAIRFCPNTCPRNRGRSATMKDGETTLTLLFRFDQAGLIQSACAEARGRTVNGAVPRPGRAIGRHYEWRDGMRLPLEGEVRWLLPDGPKPYCRGRITRATYEFTR